ncbi:Uma2 family endonuclease [Kitasatospora sp. NPDC004669]|uniref:Uma2 family endonuclease n=1 Tax=Kitasatospora sp. NPDC004669 TaxID=3154555 RepID=UPI0033AAEA55
MSVAAVEHHVGPWTVDDVLALPEDTHHRVELLGGALLLTPHPDVPHQRASSRLAVLLNTAIGACAAPFEVLTAINLLVPDGLLIPDLVVADANAAATADSTLRACDVLVAIEVTAPSTRVADTVLKSAMYAAVGIPHYWRLELDPAPRLHLGHLEDGAYVDRIVQAGESSALTDPFPLDLNPAVLRR